MSASILEISRVQSSKLDTSNNVTRSISDAVWDGVGVFEFI